MATLLGTLVFAAGVSPAALFRLRTECQPRGAVVTLGDLAVISAADAQQAEALAAIELFPAPPASQQRFVRVRELQDLLLLRGVNLAEHQFSGSNQVAVSSPGNPAEAKPQRPLSSSAAKTAHRRLVESVVQYLHENVSAETPWIVQLELDPSHARLVADPSQTISIDGGAPPWTGSQHFEVTLSAPEGPLRFRLEAQVDTSPAVVVAARSLPQGTLIRATDVELQRGLPQEQQSGALSSLDEVVGKETTRTVPKGRPVPQDSIRAPLLVRRGDVVTVYARNSGICVRTLGRAHDNGSLGELLAVESLADRSTYFARVSSVREVEVYARSARADRTDVSGLPSAGASSGGAAGSKIEPAYAHRPWSRRPSDSSPPVSLRASGVRENTSQRAGSKRN